MKQRAIDEPYRGGLARALPLELPRRLPLVGARDHRVRRSCEMRVPLTPR